MALGLNPLCLKSLFQRLQVNLYLITPLVADRSRQRRVLMKPSRFVTEIDAEDMLERWNVEES